LYFIPIKLKSGIQKWFIDYISGYIQHIWHIEILKEGHVPPSMPLWATPTSSTCQRSSHEETSAWLASQKLSQKLNDDFCFSVFLDTYDTYDTYVI
jgi:hypothetical protein